MTIEFSKEKQKTEEIRRKKKEKENGKMKEMVKNEEMKIFRKFAIFVVRNKLYINSKFTIKYSLWKFPKQ